MTAILANGDFPREGTGERQMLANAARIVACDGAGATLWKELGREADFIVGDMDSLGADAPPRSQIVKIPEQETNDLEKAVRFCRARGWRELLIFGATGKREDHAIANVFRALDLGVEIVCEGARFSPVAAGARAVFPSRRGDPVSIFAPDPATRISSTGLEWPLDGLAFPNLYCAALNRALADSFSILPTRAVAVFRVPRGEMRI